MAATIDFEEPLATAINMNVNAPLTMLEFAKQMSQYALYYTLEGAY